MVTDTGTYIDYEDHPYLTAGAAEYLRDCNVTLVCIHCPNLDSTAGNTRPVHYVIGHGYIDRRTSL
ncbi:hypothetical protein [Sphingobacterium sp.]|uniref:hypothetical protein n=1 Tax=Sphingobacterium sp. TaxID=341027 RepID=UPI0028AD1F4F|nr:hypothetical protein [Sphingobacterium sp.]